MGIRIGTPLALHAIWFKCANSHKHTSAQQNSCTTSLSTFAPIGLLVWRVGPEINLLTYTIYDFISPFLRNTINLMNFLKNSIFIEFCVSVTDGLFARCYWSQTNVDGYLLIYF